MTTGSGSFLRKGPKADTWTKTNRCAKQKLSRPIIQVSSAEKLACTCWNFQRKQRMPLQQWWLALKLVNSQGFSGLEQCLWQLEQALWSTSAFFSVEISPEEWIQRCISSNYGNMCMSIYTVHGAVWNWPWTKKRCLKSSKNPNYCCRFSARARSTAIKLCYLFIIIVSSRPA